MSIKRLGLGRNLEALLGNSRAALEEGADVRYVSPACLQPSPYQPRHTFHEDALQELANSIRQHGLLQPLLVRPLQTAGHFEILAGERRWRASQMAQLTQVPVWVKTISDADAMTVALIENLQREDLTVLEQAKGIAHLMHSCALTHQQAADCLGKSRSAVSNVLRLLKLEPAVQQLLDAHQLDMGHARALLSLKAEQQVLAAQEISAKRLSVRAAEHLVKREQKAAVSPCILPGVETPWMQHYQHTLSTLLKTPVHIQKSRRAGAGKVVIHFNDEAALAAFVAEA